MDFGELIYFIIGIAWLLYSFRKKKKAKEQKKRVAEYADTSSSEQNNEPLESEAQNETWENPILSFDDLANDLSGTSKESETQLPGSDPFEKSIENSQFDEAENNQNLDTVPPDYVKANKLGDAVERSTKKKTSADYDIPDQEEESLSEHFDLRQAVINAEILRNPYL